MHDPAHAVAVVVLGDDAAGCGRWRCTAAARLSTSWETSTVTTAGIGVITWRASCSCRWKTPVSMPASPRSMCPPAWDSAISRLSSSGEPPRRSRAHVDAEQPQDPVGHGRQHDDQRVEHDAERLQRARDASRDGLGSVDRVELRHHLAGDELRAGDQHERDDRRDATAAPWLSVRAERVLEHVRERRLAQRADADRGQRHADLARRRCTR